MPRIIVFPDLPVRSAPDSFNSDVYFLEPKIQFEFGGRFLEHPVEKFLHKGEKFDNILPTWAYYANKGIIKNAARF